LNFRKLNLLKNFNHVIKEIIEKDLDLSGNIETVNILKNEFLGDLPVTNNTKIQTTEDKENINSANIQNKVVVKPSNDPNVDAQIQTRKKDPTFRKTYYKDRSYNSNSYHQQPFNSNKLSDQSIKNPRVSRQEGSKTHNNNNYNKFSASHQNNPNYYQSSSTENKGTNKNSNYYNNYYSIYEESIYIPIAEKEKFIHSKANM